MGNSGVYGTKKFERLDYSGAVSSDDIEDASVTATDQAVSGKRQIITIQEGTGALAGQLIPKRGQSFYLEKAFVIGKNKAATSAATFTPTLHNGTTAITLPSLATTVTGAVATASTAIGSTQSGDLKVTFPATTYFGDTRCVVIQGYNE